MSQDKGLIYILTNPSFPNYQKIGKTVDLKQRLNGLNDKSCLPFSFRVYATYEVAGTDMLKMVEEQIFKLIDQVDDTLRAREENDKGKLREREFFAIDRENAYAILESVATLRGDLHNLKKGMPTKKEVEEAEIAEVVEQEVERQKGVRFTFANKGIPMGAKIYFVEDNSISVEVVGDMPPVALFEGKKWKLSPLAGELKKRNGTAWASNAYQGAQYFTYNGTILTRLPDVEV
ncbi:MAG: GIY-YIG nuclease family protein [Clostridiales bacterium]|jgi:hypothetical protein|nr:GIY-YIG nuclease family protein [Clostridiales bacterium]